MSLFYTLLLTVLVWKQTNQQKPDGDQLKFIKLFKDKLAVKILERTGEDLTLVFCEWDAIILMSLWQTKNKNTSFRKMYLFIQQTLLCVQALCQATRNAGGKTRNNFSSSRNVQTSERTTSKTTNKQNVTLWAGWRKLTGPLKASLCGRPALNWLAMGGLTKEVTPAQAQTSWREAFGESWKELRGDFSWRHVKMGLLKGRTYENLVRDVSPWNH